GRPATSQRGLAPSRAVICRAAGLEHGAREGTGLMGVTAGRGEGGVVNMAHVACNCVDAPQPRARGARKEGSEMTDHMVVMLAKQLRLGLSRWEALSWLGRVALGAYVRNSGLRANTGEWTLGKAGVSNPQTVRGLWLATTTHRTSTM